MKNQLSNISVQYRKFSKGQYIEDPDQFNEFLDFFEDQDRLSRVLLQGVGIVCGLKPKLIYKNRLLNSIQLSQGVAITTDGDLLTLNTTSKTSEDLYMSDLKTVDLENKSFTHFKGYDNFKVKYPAFYEGSEQIELWELATAQEAKTDFQTINNLTNLEGKYLLLYLEDYEKEVKPCRGVDCDNHGIQQIRNLKVLVTTASGITHILGEEGFSLPDPVTGVVKPKRQDRLQPHPLFIEDIMEPVKQNRIILERFVTKNKVEVSDLKKMYIKAIDKADYGKSIFEKIAAIAKILRIPSASYESFKVSLDRVINQETGFQYTYDVIKDLMDTYSEIIELLPKAFTKCLPDFASFPKHIMLGKLISDIQLDFSRHQFYNSPALDDEKATQKVKTLINRFNQQVGRFDPDTIIKNKERVKITPSQKLNSLSNKAIPFYYQATEEFLKTWNFDKTSNRSSGNNLTFDTDWVLIGKSEQVSPLNLNIDNNSFYNIEGHQGMDHRIAFEQIKEIRDKQQLGFDIMLLSLEELVGNKDLSKAYFNEYVEKNSGLEHKRGVERRGTFIMVYDSIRNPKVIADFSLPYICCTPKAIVKLSLPESVICAESKPIPFTVSPMNGIVKASVGSGVKLINGQYFFDPEAVEEQYRGQEITFTVNGKPTDCSIKVVSQPEIKIEVVDVFYPEDESIITELHLKVSGEGFENYTYSWDFLNNGHVINKQPDEKGNVSYEFYNLDPKNIPLIKVSVSGHGCTQDIIIRGWYDAPVRLSLPTSVICSAADPLPFDVFPENGVVAASIGAEASVISSGGSYSFAPNLVNPTLYGQEITFTVNGQSTNCKIKVIPPPKVNFAYTVNYPSGGSTETTINIEVSGPYFAEYNYSWDFLGQGQFTAQNPVNGKISYKYTNLDLKNIPVIGVKVTGGGCNQSTAIRDWYDVPVRVSLATDIICSAADSIPFIDLFPANGVVKASLGAESSVVGSGNGNYSFAPNLVNPSLYGQYITFTVNDKATNCRIKVIPPPKVNVNYTVDYPANGSTETTINIEVSGPYFTEYTYAWDFLGTGQFTVQPLTNGKISYKYSNLDPKNIPVIAMEVTGGGCFQSISIRDWYTALSLPKSVICSEAGSINFNVVPKNGSIVARVGNVDVGGVVSDGTNYSFDPKLVNSMYHGQVITFTVNGKPTNCTIKVIPMPNVAISVKSVDYPTGGSNETKVYLEVTGSNLGDYTYNADGNPLPKPDINGITIHKLYNLNPEGNPTIMVTVNNGECMQAIRLTNWYKPPSVVINNIDFSQKEHVQCCEGIKPIVIVEPRDTKALVNDRFFILEGVANADESTILLYSWFQVSGPSVAILTFDVEKPVLKVTNLAIGNYKFRFVVFDANSNAFDFKDVWVNVS
ncbi:PKD domain-containing protein [Chryseobacterium sp. JV558]|uniref:PKD domain-containing protein n=1 Tax=Chryseobacterium sp. JV558 TaxID=2663236 RepID=UPI00299DC026|nr:hypothetical protein [Chryseobacterium sp. JV558]MDW9382825.1 hypothetical protein [Chryseobacterium sp. JV558]